MHEKNGILALLCTISTADIFTIHWIENSSFNYEKRVFLNISIKGQFKCNKCLFIKSKTPPFI